MVAPGLLIFILCSDSDRNRGKARQFREWFPGMVTSDFKGLSYGGLLATFFTLEHEA